MANPALVVTVEQNQQQPAVVQEPQVLLPTHPLLKMNVYLVAALVYFSWGTYIPLWFARRGVAFNSLRSNKKLLATDVASMVVGVLFLVAAVRSRASLTFFAGILAGIWISQLICTFAAKKILQNHMSNILGRNYELSIPASIFLGPIYLQWKINKILATNTPPLYADPKYTFLVIEEMLVGPFTDSEVFQFVRSGKVSESCLAYRPNTPLALPLNTIPDLAYGLKPLKPVSWTQGIEVPETWTLISSLVLMLMSFLVVANLSGTLKNRTYRNEDLKTVYQGKWKNRKDVLIGKAVDRYLQNARWEEVESATGDHFVKVSGDGIWRNKKTNINIHFYVDEGDFEIDSVIVDGFIQGPTEAESVVDVIVNSYHPL